MQVNRLVHRQKLSPADFAGLHRLHPRLQHLQDTQLLTYLAHPRKTKCRGKRVARVPIRFVQAQIRALAQTQLAAVAALRAFACICRQFLHYHLSEFDTGVLRGTHRASVAVMMRAHLACIRPSDRRPHSAKNYAGKQGQLKSTLTEALPISIRPCAEALEGQDVRG